MEIDDKIISDYLSGEISPGDQLVLDKWLSENQANRELIKKLEKVWQTSFPYPSIVNMHDEKLKLWVKIHDEPKANLPQGQKTIHFWKKAIKIAASLTLVLSSIFLYKHFQPTAHETNIITNLIERQNPLGQKSRIQLPDGSTIWLNAGSKISYSSDFNKKNRRLSLTGEAYFEVAKNAQIPFEVHTKELVVTAIGTSFNVNSFDENIQYISLNTGKIKLVCNESIDQQSQPSYLEPGTMAAFDNQTKEIKVQEIGGADPFGWKDGRIVFNHATIDEVVTVLERWYNVDIEIEGKSEQEWDYTTTFENEILDNVLISLKFSEKLDYELLGSQVKLKLQ